LEIDDQLWIYAVKGEWIIGRVLSVIEMGCVEKKENRYRNRYEYSAMLLLIQRAKPPY